MEKEFFDQFINLISGNAYFSGKADVKRIKEIECLLNVSLPESYKWFLEEFGHGGIAGVEILGNGLGEIPSCVRATKSWRLYGLPMFLVVIEDEGMDWIYCLDTSRPSKYECPVVDWEQNLGIGQEYFETFVDFFKARLDKAMNIKYKNEKRKSK